MLPQSQGKDPKPKVMTEAEIAAKRYNELFTTNDVKRQREEFAVSIRKQNR